MTHKCGSKHSTRSSPSKQIDVFIYQEYEKNRFSFFQVFDGCVKNQPISFRLKLIDIALRETSAIFQSVMRNIVFYSCTFLALFRPRLCWREKSTTSL